MKTTLKLSTVALVTASTALFALAATQPSIAPLKGARITQAAQDVKWGADKNAAKPATVNETLPDGAVVITGENSHVELMFADKTFVRLGAETLFGVEGIRTVGLGAGTLFVHVPKDAGDALIKTAVVTAAPLTGATAALETFNFPGQLGDVDAATIKPDARFRLSVLAGDVRLCRTTQPEECVVLHGGQALIGRADEPLGEATGFDVTQWMSSNALVTGFSAMSAEALASIGVDASSLSLGQQIAMVSPGRAGKDVSEGGGVGTINPTNLGGGGAPEASEPEDQETICHNGHTLILPRKVAEKHLATHPTDTRGPCR